MASEFSPGGGKPRMTNAQIRRLQKKEEKARKIARMKLEKAKKSDEWIKEQEELDALENFLEDDELIVIGKNKKISKEKIQKKELTFFKRLILWFKNLFK